MNRRSARFSAATLAAVGLMTATAACGSSKGTAASSPATSAASAPAASTGDASSSTPAVIGVVLPLTGVGGSIGTSTLAGLKAEASILNSQGGILGRKIQLDVKDDASDPQKAALAGRQVLSDSNLVGFIPSALSASTLAILPLTTAKNLLSVTPSVDAAVYDQTKYPYSFSITFPSDANIEATLQLAKQKGATKLGLLSTSDVTGQSFDSDAKKIAAQDGISVVGTETFAFTATDVSAQLQALRSAGANGLLIYTPGSTVGVATTGLSNLGWNVPIFGTAAAITGDVSKLVPSSVAPQFSAVTALVAARPSSGDTTSYSKDTQVLQGIQANGPIASMTNAATGVDALIAMKYAFEKAKSFDGKAAAQAMEGMQADTSISAGTFFMYGAGGPAYNATTHNPANAKYNSGFWAVVHPSPIVNGTLTGTPFNF